MPIPSVKLSRGIHVMHLFYRIDRSRWQSLGASESKQSLSKLEALIQSHNAPSNPRIVSYVNIGGKTDLAFILYAAELGQIGKMHREMELCFPPGTLQTTYSFLS